MKTDVIINRDALYALRELPSESVNCCVTSPPYYGLRDYGLDAQIGREDTPEQYIGRLVEVFRELRRVLKDDGTFLLAARFHAAAAVCVCDIQPKCPVVFECPAQLPEHFHKPPDILLRRVLTSNLRVKPVVP